MGGGTWTRESFGAYATVRSESLGVANYADARPDQVFQQRGVAPELSPHRLTVREARDSDEHPLSTPLILGLDVTGSMGAILQQMATQDVNALMTTIYDQQPITDPQIMCLGIGDLDAGDKGPLQVTQFESDIRVSEQLENVWLEGGGGGNHYEGYAMAWYMASEHTVTDAFEKRRKKGYIFTIGDELPTPSLPAAKLTALMGREMEHFREVALANRGRIPATVLLERAQERWEVFHVVVLQGNYAMKHPDVVDMWRAVLGQHVLPLTRHEDLASVIVAAIQIAEGADPEVVAAGAGAAAAGVRAATRGIRVR